jgi:hypothetical protein
MAVRGPSRVGRWVFERDGNAVAAVLLGTAGLLLYGVILGPIAIALGILAKGRIRRTGAPGNGTATLGIVIGVIATLIPFVLLAVD